MCVLVGQLALRRNSDGCPRRRCCKLVALQSRVRVEQPGPATMVPGSLELPNPIGALSIARLVAEVVAKRWDISCGVADVQGETTSVGLEDPGGDDAGLSGHESDSVQMGTASR